MHLACTMITKNRHENIKVIHRKDENTIFVTVPDSDGSCFNMAISDTYFMAGAEKCIQSTLSPHFQVLYFCRK